MNELALFAGAGGGILGGVLLGWRTVCAVENNPYCVNVLMQRQNEGSLPPFPIWDDVRTFDGRAWRGKVDVVTAGFPCQPFSFAGRPKGESDERNLWPETIRVLREVRPQFALLENVPGLLAHEYFGTILGDLAESGFDAEWACFPAYIAGAPQVGTRLWIVVQANCSGLERLHETSGQEYLQSVEIDVPEQLWETNPEVYRRGHGVADRVERLRALGNGQVPAVAASAWVQLSRSAAW